MSGKDRYLTRRGAGPSPNKGGNAVHMDFDFSSAFAGLDALAEESKKVLRKAVQTGAQILYNEVKMRVPVGEKAHWFHGTQFRKTGVKYHFEPGTLRDSIYQVFSKDNSSPTKATYHIAWNHQKAPYGFMVEFGTSRAPAHPFLRPAYDYAGRMAVEAAYDVYVAHMHQVIASMKAAA